MSVRVASLDDVLRAEAVIRGHLSPAPLIRSYPLEKELGLSASRRVWLKDYGWTPVGSFKLLGALFWMDQNKDRIGDRPVAAHSSGNFACGISFAGMRYKKRVLIVMPEDAPQVKFEMARSFGAEVRTYDKSRDHLTGDRDRMTREMAEQENAIQASPYDDADVIAGNGVGGVEIAEELKRQQRSASHLVCQVSGGGLMAGHAIAMADRFPGARIVGVEPTGAGDFKQSLERGERSSISHPQSICDGLLSYDVGEHNWPILKQHVTEAVTASDEDTRSAMRWLYDHHGIRTEPSGAIATASVLHGHVDVGGDGDVVIVVSGRNIDEQQFRDYTAVV